MSTTIYFLLRSGTFSKQDFTLNYKLQSNQSDYQSDANAVWPVSKYVKFEGLIWKINFFTQ